MAIAYKTPGVYIEEVSKFPPSVTQVETAIPAFIGYTQIAKDKTDEDLRSKPKRIVSMLQYEQYFGKPQPEQNIVVTIQETQNEQGGSIDFLVTGEFADGGSSRHIMYYCLQAYFSNGGGACYIVSVGPYGDLGVAIAPGQANPPTGLYAGLAALEKESEPTLIVFPESQGIDSVADQAALHNTALEQCEKLKDRFVVMSIPQHDQSSDILAISQSFRDQGVGTDNLKYGAVYGPNIETLFNYDYDNNPESVEVKHTVITPSGTDTGPNEGSMAVLKEQNNALFNRVKRAIEDMPLILPPAPMVVGQYVQIDEARGVFKAPANVSLNSVIGPVLKISNDQQERLNVDETAGKSINVIRSFVGRGTLIWGARTLAGNDNEWKYISVRRFFNMVEESIMKATERFVFEPNDANTWVQVKAMIENFLTLQWRSGALQGAKPEQAFQVIIGLNETMTPQDILEGRMIVEIRMAVVRPAEFIILKFYHKMQES